MNILQEPFCRDFPGGTVVKNPPATILQPVDQKPQLQKDRKDEKAEGYVPDEGTRKNPRKTTK